MNPTRKLGIFGSRSSIQHVCTECALQAQIKPVKCGSLPLSKLRSRVQYNTIFKKMLHPSLQERHGSNISVAKWDTCPTGLPTLSMQSLVSQSRPKHTANVATRIARREMRTLTCLLCAWKTTTMPSSLVYGQVWCRYFCGLDLLVATEVWRLFTVIMTERSTKFEVVNNTTRPKKTLDGPQGDKVLPNFIVSMYDEEEVHKQGHRTLKLAMFRHAIFSC